VLAADVVAVGRGGARRVEQPVGGGVQDKAELVGLGITAGGAVRDKPAGSTPWSNPRTDWSRAVLERQWEEALATELELTTDHERMLAQQPAALTASERAAIRRLATDIPALWRASTTTSEDRQAIVRVLLERVLVTVEYDSETITIEYHWAGGHRTQVRQIRAVARLEQLSYPRETISSGALPTYAKRAWRRRALRRGSVRKAGVHPVAAATTSRQAWCVACPTGRDSAVVPEVSQPLQRFGGNPTNGCSRNSRRRSGSRQPLGVSGMMLA
jgi:hypothetical protein